MAGSITVSSITLDSDNTFSIKSNTGATILSANGTGLITGIANGSSIVSAQLTTPTVSGNTSFNTNTLFVDATNSRVGVGTILPNTPLTVATTGNFSGSGVRVVGKAAPGTYYNELTLQNDGTVGGLINTSGYLSVTVDNTETIRFPSGGGIKFPATQQASSDANTLDDYEEGSWTPAISTNGSGSPGHITQYGRYVKIGKQVTLHCYLVFTKNTMSGGGLSITGIPFTSSTGQPFNSAIGMWYLPNGSPGYVYVSLYFDAGTTIINTERLLSQGIDSTQNNIQVSEIGSSGNQYLAFVLTYFV